MQYEERDDEHEDEVRPHLVPTSSLSKSGCAIHRGRMTMRTTSLRCRLARTQVGWQLASLRRRFGRAAIACLLLLLALRPALADHDQCARACRVANGHTGAPAVLGHTGDWFDATVSGRRLLSSPHECECYAVAGGAAVPHPRVPRLHAPLETAEQWHFRTRRVCGADSKESTARPRGRGGRECGRPSTRYTYGLVRLVVVVEGRIQNGCCTMVCRKRVSVWTAKIACAISEV